MKLIVILATVVAHTCAFPNFELLHPSPVNPDVLVAIKPEEKITLITDLREIAKFKRETKDPFYPTVLPKRNEHRIAKRDENINGQKFHDERKHEDSENIGRVVLQKPQILLVQESTQSLDQHKRDIPVPLVPKYHHPEKSSQESNEMESDVDKIKENLKHNETTEVSEQQKYKRDNPVPLVPNYQHPKETVKNNSEQDRHKDSSSKIIQIPAAQETHKGKHFKEGQSMSEPSSNATKQFSQQQKRELQPELTDKTENNSAVHNINKENESISNHSHKISSKPVSNHNAEKPNDQNDEVVATDTTKSTTTHHLARPHPVPVAELFAKRDNN